MTRRNRKRQTLSPAATVLLMAAILLVVYGLKAMDKGGEPAAGLTVGADEVTQLLHPATNRSQAERVVEYDAMTVSFNPEMHVPNWVSWELLGAEVDGDSERRSRFTADEAVEGCAQPDDYTGSGYDRGHMAPAADMKWSEEAMTQSFMMTNICPQVHALNSGSWKNLEDKCRQWAMADSAIIVITGPVLTDTIDEYIGPSGVAVPKRFFKVVLSPYAQPPRGIGFVMPNGKVAGGMQAAAVSIDEVERITGHDFFASLPDSIEAEVEAQCRFNYWSNLK